MAADTAVQRKAMTTNQRASKRMVFMLHQGKLSPAAAAMVDVSLQPIRVPHLVARAAPPI
jgi:hypothetical protein